MIAAKRPRLQRLDGLFTSSRTFDLLGVATVLRLGFVLDLVPGSLCGTVDEQKPPVVGEDGHVVDEVKAPGKDQQKLIRHFKWVLQRRNDEENDVGTEVVQQLTRMRWRMPRSKQLSKEVADFIDTQKQLQHGKEMGHDLRRDRLRRRRKAAKQ